jgi:hypothetical protein
MQPLSQAYAPYERELPTTNEQFSAHSRPVLSVLSIVG